MPSSVCFNYVKVTLLKQCRLNNNFYQFLSNQTVATMTSRKIAKDQDTVVKDRLYPYLFNASQRNKEILLRTILVPKEETSALKKSLSPFRWTNKNFALPLLKEKTQQADNLDNSILSSSVKRYSVNESISLLPDEKANGTSHRRKVSLSRYDRVRSRNLPLVSNHSKSIEIVQQPTRLPSKHLERRFIFKSNDEYIRKVLLSWGWTQTKTKNDNNYNLRWTNNDSPTDYINLKQNQFFNHLKNSEQLTDKGKLTIHLSRQKCDFYPRTYDLSTNYYDFITDFTNTGILCLLKRHIQMIKLKCYNLFINPHKTQLGAILRDNDFKAATNQPDFLFNIGMVIHLCLYLEKTRKQMRILYFQYEEDFIEVDINIDEKIVSTLLTLSRSSLVIKSSTAQFDTPSPNLISLLVSYHRLFSKHIPHFNSDGLGNIWILKPTSSSKGQGIELINKLELNPTRMHNKIAQKYIQHCLLMKGSKQKHLQGKKFDVRQWVLVTGDKKIYRFKQSYLRFCSEVYSLDKLKQQRKHLTNYYINRGNFQQSEQQSILQTSELFDYLLRSRDVNMQEHFNRQLDKIIVESITSARTIQYQKNCFQLFGFDLLLDESYKLWLMEVNLSPACEARSGWLEEMLYSMSQGLLSIAMPEHIPLTENNQWKLIYEEPQYLHTTKIKRQPQAQMLRTIDLEGSVMKDVRRKVNAKKAFLLLVGKYQEYFIDLTKKQLSSLKPLIPPTMDSQYFRTATLVKTLQMLVNFRQRRAFTILASPINEEEYYHQHLYDYD